MSTVATAPLTPKSDTRPHVVKLKIFWKTTRQWTDAEVADYRASVPILAEQIRGEQYWSKNGDIHANRFTCEDFALRVLIQYAASNGLPIKLTDGVRTYRNMELYGKPEHGQYDSSMYGFADMVELTYGAPDMQRSGSNTVRVSGPDALLPGDILAQANDWAGIAHHVQLVISKSASNISVMQGNSSGVIVRPLTTFLRVLGMNRADPQNGSYAGVKPETGSYSPSGVGWDYKNDITGRNVANFLKEFELYRWNFFEFNR
ncbi:hypothetical protein AWB68_02617 [Caballeronia choica]|jgi:hypothetical protein|uniref:Uncharacterized protein n=1 Tax=Caballeronia choica TaxID=326476 RepID=A0A158ICQ3_9BURK|nr:hypothetical protein [Caballeronia choica]SAL54365.1 hypothetical protein AWB68_02617 [Caballeronia choica]